MGHKGFSLDMNEEVQTSKEVNNDLWYMAHTEPQESKTPKFVGISAALHAALLAGIMLMSVTMMETPKMETVTIEIEDSGPLGVSGQTLTQSVGEAAPVAPRMIPQPAVGAMPENTPIAKEDVIVAPKEVKTAPKIATKVAAVRSAPKVAAKASSSPVRPMTTESDVEVPETLDDINAPDLEESHLNAKAVADLNEADLNSTFAKVDRKNAKGLKAVKDELNQDADSLDQEQNQELAALEQANEQDARMMAAKQETLRQKNAQMLAAVKTQEAAAAEAAREKAAQESAARAAAQAAAVAAAGRTRGGEGRSQGLAESGQGGGSSGGKSGAAYGVQGNVRSLDDLRQMPGNPRPAYAESERYQKQQGEVVYLAYVNKAGQPVQFRQLKSTGYSNLDSKTLEALKAWKFYPGQEGWVEIPFRWDLRGGPQETSALARRKVSKN